MHKLYSIKLWDNINDFFSKHKLDCIKPFQCCEWTFSSEAGVELRSTSKQMDALRIHFSVVQVKPGVELRHSEKKFKTQ